MGDVLSIGTSNRLPYQAYRYGNVLVQVWGLVMKQQILQVLVGS